MTTNDPTPNEAFPELSLEHITPAVVELLGAEDVAFIETLSAELQAWQAILHLPLPPAGSKDGKEPLIADTPAAQTSIDEIRRAEDAWYDNPTSEQVIEITRPQAPILSRTIAQVKGKALKFESELAPKTEETSTRFNELTEKSEDVTPEEVRDIFDEICDFVAAFPSVAEGDLINAVIDGEILNRALEARTLGARKNPQLIAKIRTNRRLPLEVEQVRQAKVNQRLRLAGEEDEGYKQAHEDEPEVASDVADIESTRKRLSKLWGQNGALHRKLRVLARKRAVEVTNLLLGNLEQLKKSNAERYAATRGELEGAERDDYSEQVIEAERYLVEHSREAVATFQDDEPKLAPGSRPRLRALTEQPIKRAYEQELKARGKATQKAGEVGLTQEVAPDPDFRQNCAVAKKVIDGGSRLDHPQAAQLAKMIHGIGLGEKAGVAFRKPEQGLIIAIITGKLPAVLAAIDRVQASDAGTDNQIRMWRQDAPRQALALTSFDLRGSVITLKQIFDDPHRRNDLINPLNKTKVVADSSEMIRQVHQTISELHEQLSSSENQAGTDQNT